MSDSDSDDTFGPALPPGFKAGVDEERKSVIGPALPPGFAVNSVNESESPKADNEADSGDDNSGCESDDDGVIGPLLPGQNDSERGYVRVKRSAPEDDGREKREEWMTVIPKKVQKKMGFKSVTQFAKKVDDGEEEPAPKAPSKKELELAEAMKNYTKKKRPKTLLELHEEKAKKQRKEEKTTDKRLPLAFNPEVDLHVRNFDEKQKKSVIEKSKFLNTRFQGGSSTSKFL
jgi:bifunctional DNA-binding transcriptional regulator/antitoxin component of YhaV-PrlF toxin-antitoxin module